MASDDIANETQRDAEEETASARKKGNAKWRETYRRRLRDEKGLIQVNVIVPHGAAELVKEFARRLRDGTWPEFEFGPWDEESRETFRAYMAQQRAPEAATDRSRAASEDRTPEDRTREDRTPEDRRPEDRRPEDRRPGPRPAPAAAANARAFTSSPRAYNTAMPPRPAAAQPAEETVCPVSVRFAHEPDAEEVAMLERAPFHLRRGHGTYTWTGQLPETTARRLRASMDYRLSPAKPVVTIHHAATSLRNPAGRSDPSSTSNRNR